MKRRIVLSIILLLGLAAIIISERRKVDVPASPSALLYLVADTEQELTRMPVRFTRMSDEEEIGIGNALAAPYESEREAKKNPDVLEIEKYLTQVGLRLSGHAHRRLPYNFHYVADDQFLNAFALPGGHIYVGAGLLALMDSEDELAAVMAHEIEHVDHYHCAERAQQERALRKLPLLSLPVEVFEAGYSKDQELEADREGTRLAVESGYSATGAIRMFETFQRLYEESRGRTANPQDELASVATDALEGYFRSHPLASERIAQVQTLIASNNWQPHAERDLAVAYVFQTNRAARALDAKQFPQAQQLAVRSLEMHPGQPKALLTMAKAQLAQADFAASATSYRKLLDLDPADSQAATSYAQALAAADRQTAAQQFRLWMNVTNQSGKEDLEVPAAGLSLLAGEPSAAKILVTKAQANQGMEWAPTWLGQLGWWYYLAGDHATALELLSQAVQLRPGSGALTTQRAWTLIEDRKLSDALDSLESTSDSEDVGRDKQMASAVVYWLSHQADNAMSHYETAIYASPEWKNPRWVQALYSPLVAQSIREMQADAERRHKIQMAAHP
jgi:predicted Zn-dependent protease